jgi:hypothetical protein
MAGFMRLSRLVSMTDTDGLPAAVWRVIAAPRYPGMSQLGKYAD